MQRRRELLANVQKGFNYLDPKTWWISTTATDRQRSPWGGNYIDRVGNHVVLTRAVETAGLTFRLGRLIEGKTYTLSGIYSNSNDKAYIGRITSDNGNTYICTRDFTLIMQSGVVSFTPQYTAEYDFLIWHSGRAAISAESVILTEN